MKMTTNANYLGNEIITSQKNGKSFNILRWVGEDGKVVSAFSNDLNVGSDLERFGNYLVTFDYVENGNYKSLSFVSAE